MQARFLLGPAGSGKTFRCLAEVRAALADDPAGAPLIFLAPKQATFQLERQLLAGDSLAGYARLQIFSFERLARFVLDQLGVAPPKFLSEEGRLMVLRALLLRHADELQLFRGSARRPGFAQELANLLNEFQHHHLTPAKLRELVQHDDVPRELRAKLHDLALLAEKYAGWLAAKNLQDGNHLLDCATDALRRGFEGQNLDLAGLWLDGFAEMTPQELDLLAATVPRCATATLAFCVDENGAAAKPNSWLSIWNAAGHTVHQCRQRLENLPDIEIQTERIPRHPRENRFSNSAALQRLEAGWQPTGAATAKPEIQARAAGISITVCPDPDAEAVFAAREVLKFVRAGNRFRDCAVLVRSLDPYHQSLARAFRRYEIAFFLDRRESVAHHPLAELTRSALRTVAFEWQNDDWFAALKAGFAPVPAEKIDALENAALEFGWRGKKWRAPLPEENCERLRQIILPPFENFRAALAREDFQPDGHQLAAALRGLWADLQVEATLEQWTLTEEKTAVHATVWEQMDSWLENLALAFAGAPLPLRDWLPVCEAGLANLTVGVIPPALDQVLIGAIDRARNPELKFTLVLGLNETVFPAAPPAQTILTEADRDRLAQSISLGPDVRGRLARERYYGYIACTRAGEKLALTLARQDADGNALNPSPFIAQIKRLFPGLAENHFQNEIAPAEMESINEIAPLLAQAGSRQAADPNWQKLLALPALAALAKNLAALREPAPDENLSPALAGKLYGTTLRTSVSRLEEFAACPFRFFIRSGLRADERKIFELDARERGSFQHDVLKLFHEQLAAENKKWRDITPEVARVRIGKIAAAQMEHFRDGLFRDSPETLFAARALAAALQDFVAVIVAWLREQNEFDPVAAELEFDDKPGARVPAWKMDLGGGRTLALHGRIDRVDLWRDKNGGDAFALVLDYKSSTKKLDKTLVAHGVQLQLLAYLNVLRHWKNPQAVFGADRLVPAGVFYVNLRGESKSGGSRTEILAEADASRRLAYRHTGRFDAGILNWLDRVKAKDQFSYQLKNNGDLYANSTEALPRAEFEALLDRVETQLRDMGKKIFAGVATVDPYRKGSQTPCEFCDYQPVCRIDKGTHHFRVLRAPSTPD